MNENIECSAHSYPVMDGERTRRCRRIAVVWLAVKNEWRGYCPQHAVIFLGRPAVDTLARLDAANIGTEIPKS